MESATRFEVIEPETLEEESLDDDAAEAAASRRMMESLLRYATSQGMCNRDEADMWLDSFDMAEKQEYRDNLIDIFSDCLATGEDWLRRAHEVLASKVLSTEDRRGVERLLGEGDFKERERELTVVERTVAQVEKATLPRYQQQVALLGKIASASIVKSFEAEFKEAELERKAAVVKKMEQFAKSVGAEVVPGENAIAREAVGMIRQSLAENNFLEARRWLDKLGVADGFRDKYRTWLSVIDAGEIKFVKQHFPTAA